jgi:hypothetical protein
VGSWIVANVGVVPSGEFAVSVSKSFGVGVRLDTQDFVVGGESFQGR